MRGRFGPKGTGTRGREGVASGASSGGRTGGWQSGSFLRRARFGPLSGGASAGTVRFLRGTKRSLGARRTPDGNG